FYCIDADHLRAGPDKFPAKSPLWLICRDNTSCLISFMVDLQTNFFAVNGYGRCWTIKNNLVGGIYR
ncbi:MAG: hypothetical protein MR871_00045, partial [Lachnospiraceae bacterium]|nr:hypothetical protein [Lachnospiraceae bacterium]